MHSKMLKKEIEKLIELEKLDCYVEEFSTKVDLDRISWKYQLSESFMDKHWEDLNKVCISKYQKLSEPFMDKHWEDLDKVCISKYQKLSKNFIQKYNLTIDEDNWLYKDYNFKLDYIKNNTSYEIEDDSIIAYKSVRSDNYSIYNFQYLYEVGKIYESHCDCTKEENSFGLSAWTKKDALEYNDTGKLLKVKIKIKDIGRIVHNNGKIRCFRFEVLEESTRHAV